MHISGKMSKDTAAVSLSPMITVTPVSGFVDKPQEEFDTYLKDLDDFVAKNCTYPERNCDLSKILCNFFVNAVYFIVFPSNYTFLIYRNKEI